MLDRLLKNSNARSMTLAVRKGSYAETAAYGTANVNERNKMILRGVFRQPGKFASRWLFLVVASLFAQDANYVVNTKLVVVNVTVKDKAGRLITNLKQDDFQILEDGV